MVKVIPRLYKCSNCGRETYNHYEQCLDCKNQGTVLFNFNKEDTQEEVLRKKLHNAIDVMSLSQLTALHNSLFK